MSTARWGWRCPASSAGLKGVPGIDAKGGRVGRLFVRGGNVMKGYLKDEKANYKYLVEDRGWHDTGDIVETTAEGFLKIVGRVRRFAKVGGEMVSLAAVEDALEGALGGRGKIDSRDRGRRRADGGETCGRHGQREHRRESGAAGAAGIGFFRPGDPERSAFREEGAEAGYG